MVSDGCDQRTRLRGLAVICRGNWLVAVGQIGGDRDVELILTGSDQSSKLDGCGDTSDLDDWKRGKAAGLGFGAAYYRCRSWTETVAVDHHNSPGWAGVVRPGYSVAGRDSFVDMRRGDIGSSVKDKE